MIEPVTLLRVEAKRRPASKVKLPTREAPPRQTMVLGCTTCGRSSHDRWHCPLAIYDETTGDQR